MASFNIKNKVAVVTGAASGIGRALVQNLASQGCRLAISDVRADDLEETKASLGLADKDVLCGVVDVSDLEKVESFAKEIVKKFKHVDIVINNAGISSHGPFEEQSYDVMRKVIDINMWGVIYGSRAFLPYLKKQKESSLVNISSINGMVPFPGNSPYNMSKYAVLGLNETLLMELKDASVQVLSVHPGFIKTNIANFGLGVSDEIKKAFEQTAFTTPDKCANQIITGIKKKKSQIFVGPDAKLLQAIKRVSPKIALPLINYIINDVAKRK